MSIKGLNEKLRPREKAIKNGISYLSDGELLALLLRNGNKEESCIELANHMIQESEGLTGLAERSIEQLMEFNGIGLAKATEIAASIELSKRISYERLSDHEVIAGPESLLEWLKKSYGKEKREVMVIVFLNGHNRLIGHKLIYKGTSNELNVAVNEIFNEAIVKRAVKIILVHNHPSGIVVPSIADDLTTERIVEAGKLLGIRVVDHIIVSANDYYSYSQAQKI